MKKYIIWNQQEESFLIIDPDGYEKVGWTRDIKKATEFSLEEARSIMISNPDDLAIPSPYCHLFYLD